MSIAQDLPPGVSVEAVETTFSFFSEHQADTFSQWFHSEGKYSWMKYWDTHKAVPVVDENTEGNYGVEPHE